MEGTEEEGSVVNVQCLHGPLLWSTALEMLWKEEFIRSKDLSMREGMSSDVSPFVSIFGRILILMVPAGENTVRSHIKEPRGHLN